MKAKKLFVEMVLPVIGGSNHSHMAFTQWLPQKEDVISVREKNITVNLWFEKKVSGQDLSKHIDILVHQVYATAIVEDVETELLSYIRKMNPKTGPTKGQEEIHKKYHKLGKEVYKVTIESYNRLATYLRDIKGQYWLKEYGIDFDRMSSMFHQFNAKAKIDNGDQFRWRPAIADTFHIMINKEDTSRLLKVVFNKVCH